MIRQRVERRPDSEFEQFPQAIGNANVLSKGRRFFCFGFLALGG